MNVHQLRRGLSSGSIPFDIDIVLEHLADACIEAETISRANYAVGVTEGRNQLRTELSERKRELLALLEGDVDE